VILSFLNANQQDEINSIVIIINAVLTYLTREPLYMYAYKPKNFSHVYWFSSVRIRPNVFWVCRYTSNWALGSVPTHGEFIDIWGGPIQLCKTQGHTYGRITACFRYYYYYYYYYYYIPPRPLHACSWTFVLREIALLRLETFLNIFGNVHSGCYWLKHLLHASSPLAKAR
jgi:hypothetical protein